MISKKSFNADGINIRFLSDFIIRNEQYARPYVFIYDNALPADGTGDVLQDGTTDKSNWDYPNNLWKRGTITPKSEDLVPVDKWQVVDNSILFFYAPPLTSTVYLEVATTQTEFGDTLIAPSLSVALEAEANALNSANNAATSAIDAKNSADSVDATKIVHTDGSGLDNELGMEVSSHIKGMKNLIINGNFDVWQRGTSFAYTGGDYGYYTADRVITNNQSDGQFTLSKSEINGSNSIKFNVDTAVSDLTTDKYWYGLRYIFEGQDLYSIAKKGKTVTLSFIFNSNVVGEYPISYRNVTETSTNCESYVTTFNYTTANTPQKVEVQISLNHTFSPALLNDNNQGLDIVIGFLNQGDYVTSTINAWQTGNYITTPDCVNWGSTADNFIEIAELQLEEGGVSTPFEHRPYGLEFNLCQRYYEILNIKTAQIIVYTENGDTRSSIPMKVEKRVIPSCSITPNTFNAIWVGESGYVLNVEYPMDPPTALLNTIKLNMSGEAPTDIKNCGSVVTGGNNEYITVSIDAEL